MSSGCAGFDGNGVGWGDDLAVSFGGERVGVVDHEQFDASFVGE